MSEVAEHEDRVTSFELDRERLGSMPPAHQVEPELPPLAHDLTIDRELIAQERCEAGRSIEDHEQARRAGRAGSTGDSIERLAAADSVDDLCVVELAARLGPTPGVLHGSAQA